MANIELLAEITASGMYIFDYFTKVFLGLLIKTQTKSTLLKIKIQANPNDRFGLKDIKKRGARF